MLSPGGTRTQGLVDLISAEAVASAGASVPLGRWPSLKRSPRRPSSSPRRVQLVNGSELAWTAASLRFEPRMHPTGRSCAEHVRIALSLLGGDALDVEVGDGGHTVTSPPTVRARASGDSPRPHRVAGFVLRPLSGGAAATIHPSQWFQLIAAGGSLFMAASARPQLPQRHHHRNLLADLDTTPPPQCQKPWPT